MATDRDEENRVAYEEYVADYKAMPMPASPLVGPAAPARPPLMSYEEWAAWRVAQEDRGTPSDTSPLRPADNAPLQPAAAGVAPASSGPNAANEAMSRAGTMPATGANGLIGFDGTTALTGAPSGYTPWLTTTDGGVAAGKAPGYTAGNEYTEWADQNEEARVEWKKALWFAGYYGGQKPVLNGDLAPEDLSALRSAMELGNLNGKTWQDAIAPRVALGQQQGGAYTGKDSGPAQASGAFDQTVTALRGFAEDNGINLTEDFIGKQAKAIAEGTVSADEVLGELRDKYVAPAYPGFADDIRAGKSVRDLAAPYTATMAKLLEIPESDVKVNDPSIARAIQAVDEKGQAAHLPLWQFEQEIKKDSRYQFTQNAWNEYGKQAYKVMQMFGLQG
jgi:hypothetical protein